MGVFTLNPIAGNSYYVIAKSSDGITKRFDLPAAEEKGIALSMTHYKKKYATKSKNRSYPVASKVILDCTHSWKAGNLATGQCRQDFWKNE